jgi:phosphatidylglycerophosphate synthase
MSVQTVVVVQADESADWVIAGLRQLDRIALALNEHARTGEQPLAICLVWDSGVPTAKRWWPEDPRLTSVTITPSNRAALPGAAPVITTHCLVGRRDVDLLLSRAPMVSTFDSLGKMTLSALNWSGSCLFVPNARDIPAAEKLFLRQSGKSQDGPVSRFLNRPLSRTVTRLLLRHDITPTAWTCWLMILPVLAAVFLVRGDYWSVVAGAGLFQLFSMLDGCDGEIARAKYLESSRGRQVDFLSDLIGSLIFVIALGYGLARVTYGGEAYRWEGILCAATIAANEIGLRLSSSHRRDLSAAAMSDTLYPRHQAMIQHSGLAFFGERFVRTLVQFTKRDVAVLFFFLLALVNLPQWILHIWLVVTIVNLCLTAIAAVNVRRGRA